MLFFFPQNPFGGHIFRMGCGFLKDLFKFSLHKGKWSNSVWIPCCFLLRESSLVWQAASMLSQDGHLKLLCKCAEFRGGVRGWWLNLSLPCDQMGQRAKSQGWCNWSILEPRDFFTYLNLPCVNEEKTNQNPQNHQHITGYSFLNVG